MTASGLTKKQGRLIIATVTPLRRRLGTSLRHISEDERDEWKPTSLFHLCSSLSLWSCLHRGHLQCAGYITVFPNKTLTNTCDCHCAISFSAEDSWVTSSSLLLISYSFQMFPFTHRTPSQNRLIVDPGFIGLWRAFVMWHSHFQHLKKRKWCPRIMIEYAMSLRLRRLCELKSCAHFFFLPSFFISSLVKQKSHKNNL